MIKGLECLTYVEEQEAGTIQIGEHTVWMNLISVHEYFLVERVRKMVLLSESTRGNLVQVKIKKKKISLNIRLFFSL